MAPTRPQEGPQRLQENSKMPQGGPRGAKRGPRRAQDSPKTAPKTAQSRLQVAVFCYLIFKTPQMPPRSSPDPSKDLARPRQEAPRDPQEGPERPQEGPKRGPQSHQEAPGISRALALASWASALRDHGLLALRSRASVLIRALAFRCLVLKTFNSVVLGLICEILGVSSEVLCFSSDSPTVH